MADYNNIVTASVSNIKVARLLQTSSTKTSDLCMHKNINMWAKYKPVYSSAHTYANDQLDLANGHWKSADALRALGLRPWWYGPLGSPVYTIPVIDNLTEAKVSALWQYNRPTAVSPHRMLDFLQYNHAAVPPLSSGGVVDGTIQTSVRYQFGVSYDSDADWSFAELREALGVVGNFYLGVCVRCGGNIIAVSNDEPLSDDGNDSLIRMWVTRISSTANMLTLLATGAETSMYLPSGHDIEIFMYLCDNGGQIGIEDAGNKYSIRLTESVLSYGRITDILIGNIQITVPVRFGTPQYTYETMQGTWYFWYNDSLYAFNRFLQAAYMTITIGPGTNSQGVESRYYAYSSLNVVPVVTMVSSNGWTEILAVGTIYSQADDTVQVAKTINVNGAPSFSTSIYPSVQDAMDGTRGQMLTGIPLPTAIVQNFGDAEHEGAVTSTFDINIGLVAKEPETNFIITKQ